MGNWECDCNVIAKRACGGIDFTLIEGERRVISDPTDLILS